MLTGAAALATGCDTPPQILEISPGRNATQVPSNAPVHIHFDRPVDQASVAAHFSIEPALEGTVGWASPRELVFRHPPFAPSTTYTVRLSAGYRDTAGHVNQLGHGWSFRTEAPPTLTGSSPAPREQNVDPASDVALQFSRPMDLRSLESAISISPSLPLTVRADPADARRAIVAPLTLLDPNTSYSITLTPDARDVDGNALEAGVSLDFSTGAQRPLSHWVTFLAQQAGAPAGIWIVDAARVPRRVTAVPAETFRWSADGTRLLSRSASGAWSELVVGGDRTVLPFEADWADFLGPSLGYVYLRAGVLSTRAPSGATTVVATGVGAVAVSPDGQRVAYVAGSAGPHGKTGTQVMGYTVGLRAHYRLGSENDSVDALAWAPDGSRIAYRVAGAEPGQARIRVRNLAGAGESVTVAIGLVGEPRWQADSHHVILSATVTVERLPHSRLFRLADSDAATRPLQADQAIPTPAGIDVSDPVPSPDGHQLAFLEPTQGRDQVYVVNLDGSGFGPLTAYDPDSFPYSCRAPAWTRG